MRIIAGSAKGRRLKAPATNDTRPSTDRVREAVFSSIGGWVVEADVADLYAGSGSFGLEALSRGAASGLFVEIGRKALMALRANVAAVRLGGEIVEGSVERFLEVSDRKFHLIFMDPPWPLPTTELELNLTRVDRLLHPGGEVVISRRHSDTVPDHPETWRVATDKRYGDTRIIRYEKVEVDDDSDMSGEL